MQLTTQMTSWTKINGGKYCKFYTNFDLNLFTNRGDQPFVWAAFHQHQPIVGGKQQIRLFQMCYICIFTVNKHRSEKNTVYFPLEGSILLSKTDLSS